VRELEKAGEVEIERAPRGSKRPNLYRVRDRNPRLRAPVLLRLAEVKLLRRQLCQSKGTAASKGSDPSGKDERSDVVHQRCGRGKSRNLVRREARTRIERSRGVPEPARSLRLVRCAACEEKDGTIESLRDIVRGLELDLANANGDLTAKRRQLNEAKAQVRKLKQDREQELRETPNFELILRLAEFHRQHVQPDNARKVGAKTIEAVRDRLADTLPESDEPAYTPRYVAEAILGAKHDRWARDRGLDSLYEVCRSPESLERFHRSYERYLATKACPQNSVEFLKRRVRDLERARDSQAREIAKLRARGAVILTLGEHSLYGTSVAVNAVRGLLAEKAMRENGEQA
jgi:hypothetical protein